MTAAWSKPFLVIWAERNVQRGRELPHRVVVAAAESPAPEVEAVAVGVKPEPFGRVGLRIEAEDDEIAPGPAVSGGRCFSTHIMLATIAGHMALQVV